MDKPQVKKLIKDIEKIEKDGIDLFKRVPLKPTERVSTNGSKGEALILRWLPDEVPDEEGHEISRDLKRRYEAWFHASLKLVQEYIPYQVEEFKEVYDTMISYVTLNRYAATTSEIIEEVTLRHPRGFVDIYLREYANVIDSQANLLRSLLALPETPKTFNHRCFLTGFPCPTDLRENPNLVFVIMPFSKSFDDIYQLGIKETVQSIGLQCKRADEIIHTQNVICTAVCQPVRAARYVIADITGKNPNVFYELGLTHGRVEDDDQLNKRVIIITQNIDDIPFDLRTMSVIHYDSLGSLRTKLKTVLLDLRTQLESSTNTGA